jgi:hypothetical protein
MVIFKETKSVASAKSNGALFVSAIDPIKNTMNIGNKGTTYQIAL